MRAMLPSKPAIPWSNIDTVLLDMDGTLLDLAFDNFFWLEVVPAQYARLHGLNEDQARVEVKVRYDRVVGSLPWYCIDHWTRELGLDIRALKRSHRHLVRYLPMVPEFLRSVRQRGKRLLVVTNAHQETLAIKTAQTGLAGLVDELISAHDFAAPKESQSFWTHLQRRERFDLERTMLVEDSVSILGAAQQFGVKYTIAIRCPDSRQPARDVEDFEAVDGVAELI